MCLQDFASSGDLTPRFAGKTRITTPENAYELRKSGNPAALLEHLATAGEWLLAKGFRRIDPGYVRRTLELGYPPRSPWISVLRHLTLPPRTLLLRRMEVQMLSLLADLRAGGDWPVIAAEYWADQPPSTPLGREDAAFFDRRGS